MGVLEVSVKFDKLKRGDVKNALVKAARALDTPKNVVLVAHYDFLCALLAALSLGDGAPTDAETRTDTHAGATHPHGRRHTLAQ